MVGFGWLQGLPHAVANGLDPLQGRGRVQRPQLGASILRLSMGAQHRHEVIIDRLCHRGPQQLTVIGVPIAECPLDNLHRPGLRHARCLCESIDIATLDGRLSIRELGQRGGGLRSHPPDCLKLHGSASNRERQNLTHTSQPLFFAAGGVRPSHAGECALR